MTLQINSNFLLKKEFLGKVIYCYVTTIIMTYQMRREHVPNEGADIAHERRTNIIEFYFIYHKF